MVEIFFRFIKQHLRIQSAFFNFLLNQGKHALMVLKDERRDLYQDSREHFTQMSPRSGTYRPI